MKVALYREESVGCHFHWLVPRLGAVVACYIQIVTGHSSDQVRG